MRSLVVLSAVIAVALASKVNYDGYQVLRTQMLNVTSAKILRELASREIFDFWKEPVVGRTSDIMTCPDKKPELEKFLKDNGIHFSVMIEDVEQIDRQTRRMPQVSRASRASYDWKNYYSHEDILGFIDGLASANADWVKTVSIGESAEGRDLRVIQITKAGPSAPNVWIEAGIHAREWIAHATCTFMINELINGKENSDLIDNLNFHILPMANPDGYEYSRSRDRLWRKNRRKTSSSCYGTDLNRNFGFHWAESGVSNSPCSDVYCGPNPFSEPEAKAIKDYTESMSPIPVLGHSIHSYSQLWLWPYGYDYNAYPANKAEIKKLAEDASDALYAVHGTYFDPINSAELYPAAGATDDWYRGSLGTRYSFTTELRDTGFYGFLLPPEQIIESGEELFAGMRVVFEKLIADAKQGI